MVQKKPNSSQNSKITGEGQLIEFQEEIPAKEEKSIPPEYIIEFIRRHHLNRLWEEFIYEKDHPKIPLSATEVLAMINLPPEEQEKILKDHE